MEKYVMALDQGTTSSRCILYGKDGKPVSKAQREYTQHYPHEGWVEHDAMEIWASQLSVIGEALAQLNITGENIETIGITNQRETTIVWNKKTGEPVYNAIVWQCRRTADYCRQLVDEGYEKIFKEKTGLPIDAYFSATKLKWILDNVDGARQLAEKGDLLFGTVETWLIWKLTGGKVHITDYSNASRTMMFNIHKLKWDEDILKLLGIPTSMLPTPMPCSKVYGYTSSKIISGVEIPISGAAGDQQAALFGQTCFTEGLGKMTFGTGGFLLINTGTEAVVSKNGLLTTIAWGLEEEVSYALEGSVFVSGATVQWLRDELGLVASAAETERMAESVDTNAGVYLVPAFVGLGAPFWDPYARGSIFGLTRGANKNHIARAGLECQAYQTLDLIRAIEEDMGKKIKLLKVDGGASANNFMMQFLANVADIPVIRPTCIETTSMGAAFLAGIATGYWANKEDIKNNCRIEKEFEPNMDSKERNQLIEKWHSAVKCARMFSNK